MLVVIVFGIMHSIAKSRAQRTTVFCVLTGVKDDRDMMAFSYLPWESLQQEKVEKQVVSFAARSQIYDRSRFAATKVTRLDMRPLLFPSHLMPSIPIS